MKQQIKTILTNLGLPPSKIKRTIFGFQRYFDENELVSDFLLKKINNGVAIDVGVAWGLVSAPLLNKGWTVFGFEPDPDPRKKQAIAELLKNYCNFYWSEKAVSDKTGEKLSFYVSDESAGISSLHNFKNHKFSHTVTTINLSDFLKEKNVEKIDFLKIDTEGHDLFVLKGFPFDTILPKIVVAEFDDFKTKALGYSYKDIGDLLCKYGYSVYLSEWFPLKQYGSGHKFRRLIKYPSDLLDSKAWGNFIAVKSYLSNEFEEYIIKHPVHKYYQSKA